MLLPKRVPPDVIAVDPKPPNVVLFPNKPPLVLVPNKLLADVVAEPNPLVAVPNPPKVGFAVEPNKLPPVENVLLVPKPVPDVAPKPKVGLTAVEPNKPVAYKIYFLKSSLK